MSAPAETILVAGTGGLALYDRRDGRALWQQALHGLPHLDADRRTWIAWYGNGVADEVKPLPGTSSVLATCVAGLVAIVDLHGGAETVAWEAGAHSAEMLPGGLIAVAVSNSPGAFPPGAPPGRRSRLVLHRRGNDGRPLSELPLDDAHGVVWDAATQRLWALGWDRLIVCALVDDTLRLTATHQLPADAVRQPHHGGHDLVRDPVSGALLVTTVNGAWRLDPDGFHALPQFAGRHLKAIASRPGDGLLAWTEADSRDPAIGTAIAFGDGTRLTPSLAPYKVRWAQRDGAGMFSTS